MNLRFRLIVAFFLLSVVPLTALTLYTYANNAHAVREAAGREAEVLAGELTQRMQVVTGQLTERMGLFADMAGQSAPAAPPPANSKPTVPRRASRPAGAVPQPSAAQVAAAASEDNAAKALGQVAMLLNNIELRGLGSGRGRPPGDSRRGGGGRGFPGSGRGGDSPPEGVAPNADRGSGFDRATGGAPPPAASNAPGTPAEATTSASGAPRFDRGRRGTPPEVSGSVSGGPPPDGAAGFGGSTDQADRIRIDMMPIRREITRQFATDEQWRQLSPEERQRIIGQVNQQMFNVAMGIRMAAGEAQKKVAEAQRAADEKAHEIAANVGTQVTAAHATDATATDTSGAAARLRPVPPIPPAEPAAPHAPEPRAATNAAPPQRPPVAAATRRAAFSNGRLNVTIERNGQIIRQVDAEVNVQNLLGTVFEATRRDRGEVPFAVAKDGHLYTPTAEDQHTIQTLGHDLIRPETPVGTTVLPEWIVVTTNDPTGSGLKFGIARPVGPSLNTLRLSTARSAAFGLAFVGLALIGIVPLSSRLTRNLTRLNEGVTRIAQGDYRARVAVKSNDEVGRLARAFNQMAEDVEQHQRSAVEQERIKRELELGRQIQHDMLPQSPLLMGLTEIKGVSVPAREVGGDFFNYFQIGEDTLALLVGDVSGKGVGAALLMANLQASLRTRLALGQDLAILAHELDADIEASTPGPVYATLFVATLNTATRELRYVNAGHHPQFVLRPNGQLEFMSSSGLPVGLLSGRGYTEGRVQLAAGDLLFFYTDGLVEAEDRSGDMLGPERLESILLAAARQGGDLLANVEAEVAKFRSGREPFDDATLMTVKVG